MDYSWRWKKLQLSTTYPKKGFFVHTVYIQVVRRKHSWVLWHIRLFNAKSIFYINNQFYFKQFCLAWVQTLIVKNVSISSYLDSQTVLFQAIQFSIRTQFCSIWPIDRTLSGATTTGQSTPGSDHIEGLLLIPQSSSITGTSPPDCLVSLTGHSLGEV